LGFPFFGGEVEFLLCPSDDSSLPHIFLFHVILFLFFLGYEGVSHFSSAFINPLIKDKICNFHIFSFVLKASNNNVLNKVDPIRYAFSELIFFS
jgi:hypothetical protein